MFHYRQCLTHGVADRNLTKRLKFIMFLKKKSVPVRDCHPEEIKTRTAQRLISSIWLYLKPEYRDYKTLVLMRNDKELEIARENQALGFDDEYTINDVLNRVLLEACETPLSDTHRLEMINSSVDFEISREIQATRVDTAALEILSNTTNTRKIVISDFYMPSSDLSRILKHHNLLHYFDFVYSSCDHKLNKKSGRLFRYIQKKHDLEFNNWIHIGDNLHADVEMANKSGLQGYHHFIKAEEVRRDAFRQSFINRPFELSSIVPELELARGGKTLSCGSLLGKVDDTLMLPFAAMGLEIIEAVSAVNTKTIYFLGTETAFLQRLVNSILNSTGESGKYECKMIAPDIKALHLAATKKISPDILFKAWHRDGMRTFDSLLPAVGFDIEPFQPLLEKHSLTLDKEISGLFAPAVCNFFADLSVQEIMQARINECKNVVKVEMNANGLAHENSAFLVSTDWHADLQDSISSVLLGVRLHGFYLGLQNPVMPPIDYHSKRGFFFEFNTRTSERELRLSQFSEPLAFIVENKVHDNKIKALQNQIVESATVLARLASKRALPAYELMPLSFEILERFFTNPPRAIASSYNFTQNSITDQ